MEIVEFAKQALTRWNDFAGRSRRKEYWFWILAVIVVNIVVGIIEGILGLNGILSTLVSLAAMVPGIAVGIRRLHDIGKSGWWLLISFVPLVGIFIFFYFCIQDSQPGSNQYGANPKGM